MARVEMTLDEKLVRATEAHELFQGATSPEQVKAVFQGFMGDLGYKVLGRMFAAGQDPATALQYEKRTKRAAEAE